MALPASDTFDRPNETPLAGNWTAPDGVPDSKFNLDGNGSIGHLVGQGGATFQLMKWNADSFDGNHKSQATLGGTGLGSNWAGVAVRIQGSGQNAYVFGNVNGTYLLAKMVSGSITGNTLSTISGVTPTAGDVLRLEISGSSLTAYVNNSVPTGGTASDSTFSGGAAGLWGYGGTSYTLDDWSGDNVGAGAVVVDWLPTQDQPGIGRRLTVVTYGTMPGRN